ncbi:MULTISPECIES: hypothetical protein [Terrilactibacillus]|uniref:Uncharacterized protein n=2 Tax=Terrilactibacillus TaxID=1795633 RepID=A0A6N8CPM6_9BACI|nr:MULTISPECIES: hypothetical protein [Terrilactibacillus]MTT32082.1 hypothetical protein [Terrilactibacillus tamarindi]
MLFHILAGFVIPWIIAGFIFRNKIKLLLTFVPAVMAISLLINQFGFNFFWRLDVRFTEISLAAIPYVVGISYSRLSFYFLCTL